MSFFESFFLLFFGVDVIEDLVSFQGLRFQVIADANNVFDIDVDVPGQTKILKGVSAVIFSVDRKDEPSEILEQRIVYGIFYFRIFCTVFSSSCSFPKQDMALKVFTCCYTVMGIAFLVRMMKIPSFS